MRVFVFHPIISGYPNAKFPGVVVFSEIYQGTNCSTAWNMCALGSASRLIFKKQ